MRQYIVKLMGGDEVRITEEEFGKIKGRQGAVYVPSINEVVNLNRVERIYEDDGRPGRNTGNVGVLHDGTSVIRHFGRWYVQGEMIEEGGKLVPSQEVDPTYYPEVARDCVPSPKEYHEKYAELPKGERLEAIVGKGNTSLPEEKEFSQLLEGVKDYGKE